MIDVEFYNFKTPLFDGKRPLVVSKCPNFCEMKQSCVNGVSMRAPEAIFNRRFNPISNHPKNFVNPDANNWIAM
jgi:hypothetical protein